MIQRYGGYFEFVLVAFSAILCVSLLLVTGCAPDGARGGLEPESTAKQFVTAVLEDDLDTAQSLTTHELTTADLAVIREAWTGSKDKTKVKDILLYSPVESTPETASYGIEEIQLVGSTLIVLGEEPHGLDLTRQQGRWMIERAF